MGFAFEIFISVTAAFTVFSIGKAVCKRIGETGEKLVNKLFDKINYMIDNPKKKEL